MRNGFAFGDRPPGFISQFRAGEAELIFDAKTP